MQSLQKKLEEAEKLLKMAREVRRNQKLYFKTRDRDQLSKSMAKEKEFDKELEYYFDPNQRLF